MNLVKLSCRCDKVPLTAGYTSLSSNRGRSFPEYFFIAGVAQCCWNVELSLFFSVSIIQTETVNHIYVTTLKG